MNFVQLTCPNCSAQLEAENGIDSLYCKYCGTKILIEGQSPAIVNGKLAAQVANKAYDTKLKQATIESSERTTVQRIKSDERKEVKKHSTKVWKIALIVFGIVAALFLIVASGIVKDLGYSHRLSVEAKKSAKLEAAELERLDTLFDEIQKDIEAGNYDSALIKASRLRYSLNTYSNGPYEQWEATRESLVETINLLKDQNS